MVGELPGAPRITVAGDKATTARLCRELRQMRVTPHVAQYTDGRGAVRSTVGRRDIPGMQSASANASWSSKPSAG